MNKYIYTTGAFALALAISGLPATSAFARDASSGGTSGSAQDTTDVRGGGELQVSVTAAGTTTREAELRNGSREVELRGGLDNLQATGTLRESGDDRRVASSSNRGRELEATSSNSGRDDSKIRGDQNEEEDMPFELENSTTTVHSIDELKQTIEKRRHELDNEAASSTDADRNSMEHANPVRLAVHSLLASKELLGGIGPRVSEIAKEMNDSVATTTNAETRIHSRGFFSRLFFGGDSAAADVITQAVAQNQQRIDDLNKLLAAANVSADIQTTLKAQIAALEDAQTRLQALAQSEQKMWGLLSWRF